MSEADRLEIAYCVGALRHAYHNLITPGAVKEKNLQTFADGLISPSISILENLLEKDNE